MGLKQQLEEITGQHIAEFYESELIELQAGLSRAEALRLIERRTRVVDMLAILRGEVKPTGHLAFVITEHRGGFLIRLLEIL